MRLVSILFALILGISIIAIPQNEVIAFSDQQITRGAYGDDVIELQARLQYLGFYKSKIDGKFGYNTYWALRNFQEKYGLPVDGIAGAKTKKTIAGYSDYDEKWVKAQLNAGNQFTYYGGVPLDQQVNKGTSTGSGAGSGGGNSSGTTNNNGTQTQVPPKYTERDLQLMANAVYGEARGEPYEGQVAVAAVILNRLESPDFPNTISGIIFQPLAFTAVADGQIWLEPNDRAKEAVIDAMNGWDPSENALYYFNPKTATSKWIWSRPQIKQIGEHIFCS
ncbi:spore cortex-lytic enzyme [Lysinibacillus fusiformis]|uniref:Spore cortex-lytic enzyme n=1 Tax=Lysinibacillus fusiformis TaxID=28031 RepID=A0A1H9N293_9BACI|nr:MULTISPECIES: spore cortex-lytic enzyme [Lysinibacillus]EAZ84024.1 sporulation specific N-acetylmuramoyl-L-alanine amidase (spore cortex-lytic enzyme) [Bacillus sp. B14905]AJK88653.1 hydrolase [Lysinibacillus fusiformis]KAB0441527.1 spore cortex-lytic enzyme [Lysinibacillus fusiformis]KEK09987.1 hydrolase [Lysinibacillus sphaericus]KGA83152.1 hydrolase [Lysinibacillus fusiformis]